MASKPDTAAAAASARACSTARRFASGGRPVFVVGLRNLTGGPLNFYVRDIAATQTAGAETVAMPISCSPAWISEAASSVCVAST